MRYRKQITKRRKQIKKPKKKIREKFFFEDTPGVDIDFIEIPLPTKEKFLREDDLSGNDTGVSSKRGYKNFDEFILEHANRYIKQKDRPYGDLLRDKKRAEKLQYKIDKAASLYFTDVQFKIYVLRYKCGVKEKAIAHQMGRNQSYVAHVLKNINLKLKDLLHLSNRKRKYKKHFKYPSNLPTKK